VSLDEALGLLNKSFSVKEKRLKQLFIDVSQIARSDYKTGIQRVVRSLVLQFIECGIEDYRVEPVWLVSSPGGWHYRYARHWTTRIIGYQEDLLDDACIDPDKDDILLVADLTGGYFVEAERYGVYEQLEKKGVVLAGIVYDILPIQMPHCFPPGTKDTHEHWLQSISARARTLICISKAVADETIEWLSRNQLSKPADQTVTWFHLGADLENSAPSAGFPSEMQTLENTLANNISFLMVGTIEPRKGHQQALEAFQLLHDDNHNVCLIIVGKKGWMVDSLSGQITRAEESDKRIYWFENASDEFLEWLYQHCDCLLAASEGEGFGLPLIEAALHGMPLLARDIPVFREVAGNAAEYFTAKDAADLAGAILSWRNLKEEERHPQSSGLDYINWEQSAKQLIQALGLRTTR
jgi:glycosyltransferase involved in cell wall biosynthesis